MVDIVHLSGDAAIHQFADYNYVELVIDMDLTGFTGRAMMKESFSSEAGTEFTLEFVKRDCPAILKPKLTNIQTALLIPKTYKWDCLIWSDPGGERTLLCKGNAIVEAGVTSNV